MKEIIINIRYEEFSHEYHADLQIGERLYYFGSDSLSLLLDIVKRNIIDIEKELIK